MRERVRWALQIGRERAPRAVAVVAANFGARNDAAASIDQAGGTRGATGRKRKLPTMSSTASSLPCR
jgi:hypothetical protein